MELSSPKHDKKLVCKICECQVNCRTFNSHSNSCRDRAEVREKILRYQSRISAHINKAYDLRNQLNTNFAIEKKKLGKTLLKKNDSTPEQALQIPPSPEANLDQDQDQVANQEDNSGMYLSVDMEGSMKRSQKKSKTTCHVLSPLGYNTNDYEDETLRSLQVLKMIMQYGQNSLTNANEADPDKINDFKVKNQVNLLYVEIKDKQISEYIQQFLELIQKLIKYKGLLTKKQEDIARIEEELYSPGASDVELLSPQLKSKISYNSQISHKSSKITSLDDGNINERVFKKPVLHLKDLKETFSRAGSARNLSHREHRSSNTPLLPRKEQFTPKASAGLSRFAVNTFFKDFPSEASGSALLRRANTIRRKGKIAGDLLKDIEKIGQIKFRHEMATAGLGDSSSPEKVKFDSNEDKRGSKDEIEDDDNEEKKDGHALRRVFTFNVNKIEEKKKNLKEYINEEHEGYEGESEGKDEEEIEDEDGNKEEIIKEKKGKGHKRIGSWDNKPKKVNIKKLLEGSAKEHDLELLEEGLFIQGPVKSSFSTMDNMNLSKMLSQKRRKAEHEAMEEIEEEHESLSLFTIRGYYSDSEVNQVRKLELQNNNEMSIEDFDFIRLLGEGAYGKVYLVRKKTTGDLYAMKIIDYADKDNKNNKAKSLRAERDVYKLIQGDWVVKAYYTFNHQSYICFVQEYIIGGDLQHLLEQMGCFEESVAKFYFAELLLAVESLHELGIVHRDLKPNNVMIDATGHIKLTDFGLSEVGLERLRMNASTIRSLLTRENSSVDNNTSPLSREEALAKIERTNSTYFQRSESISQEGNDPAGTLNSIPRQDSETGMDLMMMSMSIRQNKPQTEDFSLSKNKPDEQTVFPFLATQEERSNWKKGDNPMGISQMNQSLRRKEKRRIVGTPDYIAPEIIRGEDCNDKAIDLWSLGVILYEFMVGIPPFNDDSIDKIFTNILHMKMEWPDIGYEEDCLSPEAADLMKKLMNQNPKERIKIKDVKRHPFFKGFDWQNMKQVVVPIVPKKKEIDPDVPLMDLSTIFKPNDFRLMKRNSIIQEIPTFNTKRYDLLHQLNQSLYRNHMMENSDDLLELKTQQLRNSISTLFQ